MRISWIKCCQLTIPLCYLHKQDKSFYDEVENKINIRKIKRLITNKFSFSFSAPISHKIAAVCGCEQFAHRKSLACHKTAHITTLITIFFRNVSHSPHLAYISNSFSLYWKQTTRNKFHFTFYLTSQQKQAAYLILPPLGNLWLSFVMQSKWEFSLHSTNIRAFWFSQFSFPATARDLEKK